MRIRVAVPGDISRADMADALDAALEASTAGSVPLIERGQLPSARAGIKRGVRWKPEPPGDEHFDSPQTLLRRGWGDCDDLAPWHAASLRASGEDPDAIARVVPSGPKRWHAIVERSDGSIDDPSVWAGMLKRERVSGAPPAAWAPMWEQRLALAAHPYRQGWAGRVDLPDAEIPMSWSGVALARTPAQAVVGAILGVRNCAALNGEISGYDDLRLAGLADLLCGFSEDEVVGAASQYLDGDDLVGFLPLLAPAAMSLASPMLKKLMPGGGGGARAPSGGGGPPGTIHPAGAMGPGATLMNPGGPIIVRF
jgi:hypothetical protein